MDTKTKIKKLQRSISYLMGKAAKIDQDITLQLDSDIIDGGTRQTFYDFQEALEQTMYETETRSQRVYEKWFFGETINEVDVWCLEVDRFSLIALIKHYDKVIREINIAYLDPESVKLN